jgi:hypothetical protein
MWHRIGMTAWTAAWLVLGVYLWLFVSPLAAVPCLWSAAVWAYVTVAMTARAPHWFGKRDDGSVAPWSYALFLPWHSVVRTTSRLDRTLSKDGLYTEIHPGWWVGGWPVEAYPWAGETAILDVTCELPRRDAEAYLCLPTWDATDPSLADLERGVAWAVAQRAAGRTVLVHCAHGRGRSVTVLCAALAGAGVYPDWEAAYAAAAKKRRVRITSVQRRRLVQWASHRPDASATPPALGSTPETPA